MKKKLQINDIKIQSFVTTITSQLQETVKGGDINEPHSLVLACPTEGNVSECGVSVGKDCGMFLTRHENVCEDLLN